MSPCEKGPALDKHYFSWSHVWPFNARWNGSTSEHQFGSLLGKQSASSHTLLSARRKAFGFWEGLPDLNSRFLRVVFLLSSSKLAIRSAKDIFRRPLVIVEQRLSSESSFHMTFLHLTVARENWVYAGLSRPFTRCMSKKDQKLSNQSLQVALPLAHKSASCLNSHLHQCFDVSFVPERANWTLTNEKLIRCYSKHM